jgi:hypothetical protein
MAEVIEGIFDFDFNADGARKSINALISDLKKLEKEIKKAEDAGEKNADAEKKAAAIRKQLAAVTAAEAKTIKGLTAQKKALLAIEKQLPGAVDLVQKSQAGLLRTERQLTDETKKLTKASGSAGGAFLKNAASFAAASVSVAAVKAIAIDGTKELFNLATSMEVLQQKAKTVFGDALPLVTEQAKANANAAGLTTGAYIDQAAAIADLLVPLGFERAQGADYSTQLLNRAAALSEWTGGAVSAEEVTRTLGKALVGEREGLKSLGIVIDDEIIKARLLSKGQEKLTGDALNRAKAEATLELILEKSVDAQTAYNNNSDTLIRKQAQLKATFDEVKETLATALTPAFQEIAAAAVPASQAIAEAISIVANGEKDLTKYSEATQEAVSWIKALTGAGEDYIEAQQFYFKEVLQPLYNLLSGFLVPTFEVFKMVLTALGITTKEGADNFNAFKFVMQASTLPLRALIGFWQTFQNVLFFTLRTGISALQTFLTGIVDVQNAIASISGGRIEPLTPPDFSNVIDIFSKKGKEAAGAFYDGAEAEAEAAPPLPVAGAAAAAPGRTKAQIDAEKKAAKEREKIAKKQATDGEREAKRREDAEKKLTEDLAKLYEDQRLNSLSEKQKEIEQTKSKFSELRARVIELKGTEAAELKKLAELEADELSEIDNKYLAQRVAAREAAAEQRAAAAIASQIAAAEAEGAKQLLKVEQIKSAQLLQAAELGATERAARVAAIEKNAAEARVKIEKDAQQKILQIKLTEAIKNAEKLGTTEAKKLVTTLQLELEKLKTPDLEIGVNANDEDLENIGEKIKEIALAAAGVFDEITGSIGEIFALQTQKAEAALNLQQSALDEIRANSEDFNAEQLELQKARVDEEQRIAERAAEREKRLAAVQLVTQTTLTIAKAAAAGGIAAPFTIAAALAALVAGFAKARSAAASAFYEGTDFVDAAGQYPAGRDTVPAYLNRGEAVIQTDKNKAYFDTVKAIRRGEVPADLLNNVTLAYKRGGLSNLMPSSVVPPSLVVEGSGVSNDTARDMVRRLQYIEDAIIDLPGLMPTTKVNANADGIFLLTKKIGERKKARRDRAK